MAAGLTKFPFPEMPSLQEGIVTSVDPIRSMATVKTLMGQIFPNVPWVLPISGSGTGNEGQYYSPTIFSRVLLTTSLGYPLIIGSLPRLENAETTFYLANDSSLEVDPGNVSTTAIASAILYANKPGDLISGDQVLTNGSGSFLAILKTGTILAKASSLAQIIISKFGKVVRIVASNYYRHSDSSSRVASSAFGRLYEWFGADKSLVRNQTNSELYQEVVGDVAAGELLGATPYYGLDIPSPDSRVRKYWLKNTQGVSVMTETLYDEGKLVLNVNTPGNTTVTVDNELWNLEVLPDLTSGDSAGSVVTIQPNSIDVNFHGGDTTIHIDSTGTNVTSKGHYMHIFADGVHLG